MTDAEIKKAIKETLQNGFVNGVMDKVKLAINESLKPITDILNSHENRINVVEKTDYFCEHHKENTKMLNEHETILKGSKANCWIMHAQWFVITVLVGLVAYMLRSHL